MAEARTDFRQVNSVVLIHNRPPSVGLVLLSLAPFLGSSALATYCLFLWSPFMEPDVRCGKDVPRSLLPTCGLCTLVISSESLRVPSRRILHYRPVDTLLVESSGAVISTMALRATLFVKSVVLCFKRGEMQWRKKKKFKT